MSLNAAPLRLSTTDPTVEAAFKARLHWSADTDAAIEQRVADILSDVQARGDAAVLAYTQRFDGLAAASMAELELTQAELKAACVTPGMPRSEASSRSVKARRVELP